MSADRPYSERPAATPARSPAEQQPGPTKAAKKGMGCGGIFLIAAGVVALLVGIVAIVATVTSQQRSPAATPEDMARFCVEQVAEWANVDNGVESTWQNLTPSAWDFRGVYPGGEWACGGSADRAIAHSVMVYPGADSNGIPEEIFADR